MAELHDQESEFRRLLEGMPFDDAPRPEQVKRLREQVLDRFEQAARANTAGLWWKYALDEGRKVMRKPIVRLVAAAACLAIVAFWLLAPGQQSARAFEKFADAIVQAKTARFQMEVNVEGQPTQKIQAFYLTPGKFRQEITLGKPGQDAATVINISDFSAGKMVSLQPAEKKAMIMNLIGGPKAKSAENYFERLRELLAGIRNAENKEYQPLGEKEIDGKKAVGFRYDTPAATVNLWGNPLTGTPVRIYTVWSGIPRTEVVMSDFDINVELNAALFNLTPPAGYKVQSIDVDASEPREQDLVEGFKTCAEMGGGEFPETLDTAGVQKLIIKYSLSKAKEMSDELMQQLMKEAIKIGRGFQFAMQLPESADAHYAGKGVKRGTPDRPIFWYKPEGAKTYRVLFADLTLRDTAGPPQVAGAKRLEKASKTTSPTKP
jgi:outer membrane lipoprotein-sorting protein